MIVSAARDKISILFEVGSLAVLGNILVTRGPSCEVFSATLVDLAVIKGNYAENGSHCFNN